MKCDIYKNNIEMRKHLTTLLFFSLVMGIFLNVLVLSSNNWKMPVYTDEEFNTDSHFSYNYPSDVNLSRFTDNIKIGKKRIISIGDVLISLSGILIIINYVLIHNQYLKLNRYLKATAETNKYFYE